MADSGNNKDDSGAGWWGSLLSVAKEQSGKMYEMVSQDLTEFTNTMQSDTKHVVEKTKETLKTGAENPDHLNAADRMKQGFHSLMSGITKALTIDPEDTTPPKPPVSQHATGIFDRAEARKRAIQVDTGTYLQEPSGPLEKYGDWLKTFDLDAQKGEISDLLVTMVEVRSLYTSLVPSQVSHQDFWQRYFYKVHQLHMDEERKKALMQRAERVDSKEDAIDWDEEESSGDEDATPNKRSPSKKEESASLEDTASRLQPSVSEEDKLQTAKPTMPSNTSTEQKSEDKKSMVSSDSAPLKEREGIGKESEVSEKDSRVADADPANKPSQEEKNTDEQVQKTKDIDTVTDKNDRCDKTETEQVETKVEDSKVVETEGGAEKIGFDKITETVKVEEIEKKDEANCDKKTEEKTDDVIEKDLKTKVKGDMVVVGDRNSPSSDSSGNKESSNEDWEQDFDVEVTAEDLAAASELAQKMNMSAAEYNSLTGGEEDDWENWD